MFKPFYHETLLTIYLIEFPLNYEPVESQMFTYLWTVNNYVYDKTQIQ